MFAPIVWLFAVILFVIGGFLVLVVDGALWLLKNLVDLVVEAFHPVR